MNADASARELPVWMPITSISAFLAVRPSIGASARHGTHQDAHTFTSTGRPRNPAMIAKMADTVDEISSGRFVLALGAGWHEPEYRAFGFPFDHRFGRFEESFTIIRTLLADGEIDFHGAFYDLPNCVLTPNGPRGGDLPLLVGSIGERMLRATLPYIDAWNVWFEDFANDPLRLREVMAARGLWSTIISGVTRQATSMTPPSSGICAARSASTYRTPSSWKAGTRSSPAKCQESRRCWRAPGPAPPD